MNDKSAAILSELPPESADLIKAAGQAVIFDHVSQEEMEAIYGIYGGSLDSALAMNVAFEAGYIRGVRAEHRRRRPLTRTGGKLICQI